MIPIEAFGMFKSRSTVAELIADVPIGMSQTFYPAVTAETFPARFVVVHYNNDYVTSVEWINRPSFQELPWMGSRSKPRIGVWDIAEPELIFRQNSSKICDFYSTGTGAYILSDRLIALIEALDAHSLETRPVAVRARDQTLIYQFCMPKRNLTVIDASRTIVKIVDEQFASETLRSVRFPGPVHFNESALATVHNFSDIDILNKWIWSQELVERAKLANIRGFYTSLAASVTGCIDRL